MPGQDGDAVNLDQQIADAERLLGTASEEVKEVVSQETPPENGEVKTETGTETGKPEETKVEEPKPDTHEEEDPLHGEKSKQGRKIKYLENTVNELKSTLDLIKDHITKTDREVIPDDPEPTLSEYPTADEILARDAWKDRQSERATRQKASTEKAKREEYVREYSRLLSETVDPEEDPEIDQLMRDTKDLTFNAMHTGDPKEDFVRNYRAAMKHVRSKPAAPAVNVHNKPSKVATGVNVPATKPAAKTFDRSKLDPMEREAARGLSDAELIEMFG